MTDLTRVLLWRHGRTAWNAGDRVQGQSDVELDPTGVRQAESAAPLLAAYGPVALLASDLRRASATADVLARVTGLVPRIDSRLRERCFGDWQGLTLPEIAEGWPDAYARWRRGEPIAVPGMETEEQVAERMAAAIGDAAEVGDGKTVVVVSHGGAVRRAIGELLGWPNPVVHTIGGLGNCHWAELAHGPRGWRLAAYNLGVHADDGVSERVGAEDHAGEDAGSDTATDAGGDAATGADRSRVRT